MSGDAATHDAIVAAALRELATKSTLSPWPRPRWPASSTALPRSRTPRSDPRQPADCRRLSGHSSLTPPHATVSQIVSCGRRRGALLLSACRPRDGETRRFGSRRPSHVRRVGRRDRLGRFAGGRTYQFTLWIVAAVVAALIYPSQFLHIGPSICRFLHRESTCATSGSSSPSCSS